MKRKFFSVLLALVLVFSFSLVTATPAAAAATHTVAPITFDTFITTPEGNAEISWVTAAPYAGVDCVELVNVSGSGDWVQVEVAVSVALEDISTLSFLEKMNAVKTYGAISIQLYIDYNEDGAFTKSGTADRYLTRDPASAGGSTTWASVDAMGTGWWLRDGANTQYTLDPDTVGASPWIPLADWQEVTKLQDKKVLYVVLGFGGSTFDTLTAYVDDITVNTTVYALEEPDYTTIQAAIDAASAGDTITVQAGMYAENVDVDEESITLTGASSATVTVGAADAAVSVFTVTVDNVTISGFTITGCTGPWTQDDMYAGIRFPAHVEDCNIHDNILTGNIVGILMLDTENTETTGNNTFTSNNASSNIVSGIEMQHTYGNTFTSNTANSSVYGFNLDSARNNIFTGNTANSNTKYGFFLVKGSGTVGSNYNTFTNNTANSNTRSGVRMTNLCGDSTYTGNTFDSNVIAGMELGGSTSDTTDNLTVNSNTFSGNAIGVKIDDNAIITDVVLRNNNIVGNDDFGVSVSETGVSGTVDAENNWWGNASGANYTSAAYDIAYGDIVSDDVDYEPWLLASGGATYDKTLALKDDWTLVSVDKEVTTGNWTGTTVLSDTDTILAYKYTPGTGFPQVTLATQLTSVDAYYIKTDGGGGVGINYSTSSPGVVTKTLSAGWNVISCAAETDAYVLLSQLHHVQIGEQEGTGLTSLVGQGSYNQFTNSISETLVTDDEWAAIGVTLNAFDGYWVYMNAAKSFGVIPD